MDVLVDDSYFGEPYSLSQMSHVVPWMTLQPELTHARVILYISLRVPCVIIILFMFLYIYFIDCRELQNV